MSESEHGRLFWSFVDWITEDTQNRFAAIQRFHFFSVSTLDFASCVIPKPSLAFCCCGFSSWNTS